MVLAVTTYNRKERIKNLLASFLKTHNQNLLWSIFIADDGSSDDTIEYIEKLEISSIPIKIIKNGRQGVHHQFNTIVNELEKIEFDYCFKCDDDIEFIKPRWEQLYIDAIEKSGFDHLCHFDASWRSDKNFKKPVTKNTLISHCDAKDVQGAFFTLTPAVIKKVGYMDIPNFGFRGVGHVDYTIRACRAGFNDINHPFDVAGSNEYIRHQTEDYKSALDSDVQNALESSEESKRKYEIIKKEDRMYIPFNLNTDTLNPSKEIELLKTRIKDLENQKEWYEINYGHQPKWFIRIGKFLGFFK